MEIKNRKAYFNYFVEEEIECGIVLLGTEIKAIRKGSADIKDSYVRIKNNEALIINMYIAKYDEGSVFNHDEYRERKLLLHKREILKLKEKISKGNYTLVPLKIYMKNNKAKILVGLCRGKKLYDKRDAIKKKDLERVNSYEK
ncbi:MAG: SsrA-binding protein SmpB [Mollicutes bacterium]|nr:SsrA-binding protein SmpB [Mollicutes bacterium]